MRLPPFSCSVLCFAVVLCVGTWVPCCEGHSEVGRGVTASPTASVTAAALRQFAANSLWGLFCLRVTLSWLPSPSARLSGCTEKRVVTPQTLSGENKLAGPYSRTPDALT